MGKLLVTNTSAHIRTLTIRLEVTLQKHVTEHHWSTVVTGDERGRYELVGDEAKRVQDIHERLEHLTSDKLVRNQSLFTS